MVTAQLILDHLPVSSKTVPVNVFFSSEATRFQTSDMQSRLGNKTPKLVRNRCQARVERLRVQAVNKPYVPGDPFLKLRGLLPLPEFVHLVATEYYSVPG